MHLALRKTEPTLAGTTASLNAAQHSRAHKNAAFSTANTHIFNGGHCVILSAAATKRSVIGDTIIIFLAGEAEESCSVCSAESECVGRDLEAITHSRLALMR